MCPQSSTRAVTSRIAARLSMSTQYWGMAGFVRPKHENGTWRSARNATRGSPSAMVARTKPSTDFVQTRSSMASRPFP